jgi:hypothetical protein
LAVAPDQLWATVRDVGNVSGLLNIVDESSVDGDQRSCSPRPIEVHAASMQVFDAGGGRSTFRWITDVKPDAVADGLGPMLAGAIAGMEEQYGT